MLVMLAILVAATATATPLNNKSRKEIFDAMVPSCIQNQINNPANSHLPIPVVRGFCECLAKETADRMSQEQADEMERTNDPTPMMKANQKAQQVCVAKVFG